MKNSAVNQHSYLRYAPTRTIRRYLSASSRCLCGSWLILSLFIFSCTRNTETTPINPSLSVASNEARATAVLQTGENPLWFQLTEDGPIHIGSIEDAVNTTALVPWTHAYYISYMLEKDGDLVMISNRDGFLKIAHNAENEHDAQDSNLLMYRFSGGELWRQYTSGGLVFYNGNPLALIYLNSRFLDSDLSQPLDKTWSFSMDSNIPFPVQIPALRFFADNEGWEIDALNMGENGLFYYRAAKRSGDSPQIQFFRTTDLVYEGEEISIEVFYNSFPRKTEIIDTSLPLLPDGFVYTQRQYVGDSTIASWEEQHDYSIGAAGFMLIKK